MKKIIFRKITLDCFNFFLLTIISISVIIWVLQAVNYLDFVVEDGHGFIVYFKYTLLSFPKILTKLFPFAVFFSTAYILLKYENKNELIVFWTHGINKINFINVFIKLSMLFIILHLLLTTLIVPTAQDKARSYIRSSDLDFFEGVLKPKKFIDIVNDLTIYYERKDEFGQLKNIYLKSKTGEGDFQITLAKTGKFDQSFDRKVLVLYNGKTLKNQNNKISEFKFSKSDYDISRFSSNTTSVPKIQENSTKQLFSCILTLEKIKNIEKNYSRSFGFENCRLNNFTNIYQVLYSRLIFPLYNSVLVLLSLLLIMKSKNDQKFKYYKLQVFTLGFLFIIFLETSVKFINNSLMNNLLFAFMPLVFFLITYFFFRNKLIYGK
jgi:lipopolysaccharide export system permease protein